MRRYSNILVKVSFITIMQLTGLGAEAQKIKALEKLEKKDTIPASLLPANAQKFLHHFFPKNQVKVIVKHTKYKINVSYKLYFMNGTKIEMDKKGNWQEIDGNDNPLPYNFLPPTIGQYIHKSFPKTEIYEIEKQKGRYQIELSNGLELLFDLQGFFLKIDD